MPRTTAQRRAPYLLLAPFALGSLLLIVLPLLWTFGLALAEYDGAAPPRWRGLGNLADLAGDRLFRIALANTAGFVLLAVPLRLLGALLLALLMRRGRPGIGLARMAIYLPAALPEVAYALLGLWIFNPVYGPLNLLLGALGLPQPAWLIHPDSARLAVALLVAFQLGEGFVLLLVGLASIAPDLYAAAAVDGASRWQQFRHITLPLLTPWLLLLACRDISLSIQSTFTPSLVMTKGGEPYYATLYLPLLIYQRAFDRFDFGSGAAMLLALFAALALVVVAGALVLRRWGWADGG